MAADFAIAIVGSGPAGLSAAARAAKEGTTHILLERTGHINDTIFKYQKRKHVMATPEFLPLRSDLGFKEESREEVIESWTGGVEGAKANIRLNTEVTSIKGQKGNFQLGLSTGETITAEYVVLSIGVQGNLRKLSNHKDYNYEKPVRDEEANSLRHGLSDEFKRHFNKTEADRLIVQYQLDDPDEYKGEDIVVIGCGDAGIENALALAPNNNVTIIDTLPDFPYAKPANAALIQGMIKSGRMNACFVSDLHFFLESDLSEEGRKAAEADLSRLIALDNDVLVLNALENGVSHEVRIPCDRVIARIGALPPRAFVEACGIEFASPGPTAYPHVSDTYESNVPGLYIIGALAGYPLIKHCLNQGYEVIEYILGKEIEPADEPLLKGMIEKAGARNEDGSPLTVKELVERIQQLPLYKSLTALQIREFLLHSELHQVKPGEVIFKRNDYTNSLYSILYGKVGILLEQAQTTNGTVEDKAHGNNTSARKADVIELGRDKFFGEMGLISGRRRSATTQAIENSLLLEVDRNVMVKLIRSVPEIKRVVDDDAVVRQIMTYLTPGIDEAVLREVLEIPLHRAPEPEAKPQAGAAAGAEKPKDRPVQDPKEVKANETLIQQGATGDEVYVIRKGSVTVSRQIGGKDVVLAYLPAGNYVGEMAMLTESPRSATVKAAVPSEVIEINSAKFRALLDQSAELRQQVEQKLEQRQMEQRRMDSGAPQGGLIEFLVRQGLGEATDVLLIDESLCVRCDNCEKACAETHHGVSRLNREAGPTYNTIHVPTSCRHCENPYCMKDCPADAIHRAPNGEVFINDNCIGCGNCERNCPYGVIQMAAVPGEKPSLLSWLLFGLGYGPGEDKTPEGMARRTGSKHAVKCDMCKGIDGGPSCVRACPTGAAIRVNPEQFISVVRGMS